MVVEASAWPGISCTIRIDGSPFQLTCNHRSGINIMFPIPQNDLTRFNEALLQRAVPGAFHVHYRKWLRHVLKKDFGDQRDVPRAKRSKYIPVVLSRQEIDIILSHLEYPFDTVVGLLYGCGLRLFECLSLRVQNFNFADGILTVHGKGDKDRTVPLPRKLIPKLKIQLEMVRELHDKDLAAGYAGVFLPDSLEKKYPGAAKDFIWQWFFPQKGLTLIPGTKEYRRYHLHESRAQGALKTAARRAKLTKRVKSHTFRHSAVYPAQGGATHLLQANYDIRTIQTMLGHADVRTTMIYTHCVPSKTVKEAKSPLDF